MNIILHKTHVSVKVSLFQSETNVPNATAMSHCLHNAGARTTISLKHSLVRTRPENHLRYPRRLLLRYATLCNDHWVTLFRAFYFCKLYCAHGDRSPVAALAPCARSPYNDSAAA